MIKFLYLEGLILGAVFSGAFVILYGFGSSEWRRYAIGQNLIAKAVVLCAMFSLTVISFVLSVPPWVFVTGLHALDAILAWRLVITWQAQHPRSRWLNRGTHHVPEEDTSATEKDHTEPVPGGLDDGPRGGSDQH